MKTPDVEASMNTSLAISEVLSDACRRCAFSISGLGCCHALARHEVQDSRLCTFWQSAKPLPAAAAPANQLWFALDEPPECGVAVNF